MERVVGAGSTGADAADGEAVNREPPAAFEADLCRYHTELLRYLRTKLNDHNVAADLVQEACVRIMRYRERLEGDALRSMLYRIVNNLLVDHWRRTEARNLKDHVPIEDEPLAAPDPQPEDALVEEQRLAALKRAIQSLPPKRRRVLILARLQGKPHAEVARECDISVSGVEKHLARAIVACGDLLRKSDL